MPTPFLITLTQWLIPDNSPVRPGDLVCLVETDKASQEVQAFEHGTLHHLKKIGDTFALGDPPFLITPPTP